MSRSLRMLIMPAFNEADHLEQVLSAVRKAVPDLALVVIDDGSSDETAAVARSCGATVLRHSMNLGYGAALQTGYKFALRRGASLLVQMDADGQHDPFQIARLLGPIQRDELDLVVGSRFLEAGSYEMGFAKSLGRRVFETAARLLGLRITDPTSGFQAMNRATLSLYAGDFFPSDFPDVDVLLIAHRHGLRIGEIPVEMSAGLRPSTLPIWAASARPR